MTTPLTHDGAGRVRTALTNPVVLAALIVVVLFGIGQLVSPGFASYPQAVSLLRIASFLGIMAVGQTIVILSGGEGIDLSVGQVATFAAVVASRLMDGRNDLFLIGVVAAVLAAAVLGLLNGLGIVALGIPPFVMTLGMAGVVQGLTLAYTNGVAGGRAAPVLTGFVDDALLFNVPGAVYVWILLIIAVTLLLRRTRPGWNLYAIGTNRVTAHLSTVPVTRTVIGAYVASAVFAAIGGIVLLGYAQSVFLDLANSYTLPTVAAVVLGGTVIAGGRGGYVGTAVGALLLTVLESMLSTVNIPAAVRTIVTGVILLALLTVYGRQKSLRS